MSKTANLTPATEIDKLANCAEAMAQIGQALALRLTVGEADPIVEFIGSVLSEAKDSDLVGTPYEGQLIEDVRSEFLQTELSTRFVAAPQEHGLSGFLFDSEGNLTDQGSGEGAEPVLYNVAATYLDLIRLGQAGMAAVVIENTDSFDIVEFDFFTRLAQIVR